MRPNRHLVVFAKAPVLGRVKSRLATDIGWVAATAFQRTVLRGTIARLSRYRPWRCWLAVTPDRSRRSARLWPPGPLRIGQGKGDLGDRMARVMAQLPPGPVVIVGSDIPEISPAQIARAFRLLGRYDAVLGPSGDGGYWLVGLAAGRRPTPSRIFENVRWSSPYALADTLANLEGRMVGLVDVMDDVDDGPAWERWRKR